jgi:hypothetical protein
MGLRFLAVLLFAFAQINQIGVVQHVISNAKLSPFPPRKINHKRVHYFHCICSYCKLMLCFIMQHIFLPFSESYAVSTPTIYKRQPIANRSK